MWGARLNVMEKKKKFMLIYPCCRNCNNSNGIDNVYAESCKCIIDGRWQYITDYCNLYKASEQLNCQCKNAQFTRTVNAEFNPLCGKCGKAI